MARKNYPLRLEESLYGELQKWAEDELRSVNGLIEMVLRDAVRTRRWANSRLEAYAAEDPTPPEANKSEAEKNEAEKAEG